MIVELIDVSGSWVVKDAMGGPDWATGIPTTALLKEIDNTSSKKYIKDVLKLKEAGFAPDEIMDVMKEATK